MAIQLEQDQVLIYDEEKEQWLLRTYLSPRETIAFNNKTNKWSTFYSYHPESMVSLNSEFAIFKGGRMFVLERDAENYNNLPTVSPFNQVLLKVFPTSVSVVSNASPAENKMYQSIEIDSSSLWSVPEIETENGQISSLDDNAFTGGKENIFEDGYGKKENKFFAYFLNDELSQGGVVEGDKLRDNSLVAKVIYTANQAAKLFAVTFRHAISSRSDSKN
jgi:predicted neuraminidase